MTMMIEVPELIGMDDTGGNPLLDVVRLAGLAGLGGPLDLLTGTLKAGESIVENRSAIARGVKALLPTKAVTEKDRMVNEIKVTGWLGFGAGLYFLPGWWKILAVPAGFAIGALDAWGKQSDMRAAADAEYNRNYPAMATQEYYVGPTTPTLARGV
jgi:hypothetical protein